MQESGVNSLDQIEISSSDILDSISKIPTYSASGPDGIPAILLKKCAMNLLHPLTELWTNSFQNSVVPAPLKLGIITPIYKGGPRSEPKIIGQLL